jgi:ubiquinone/menaquinone biosynthesis C-methylase UbiE
MPPEHAFPVLAPCRRVLQPGGVFLLITLGAPEHRLHMVNKPEYGWSLQVCLLPKTQDAR